ncbi:MAG: methyltransferase domain-containing protein [Rhodobacteraceae bacterium]|nr:methyltransferase domain-containing protein [Paracoccaceae bacterium]
MNAAPALFDRSALSRNRARAGHDPFLHRLAVDEVEDRLTMVNRTFTSMAVVTPFAGLWTSRFADAVCVPDDETLGLGVGEHDLVVHAMALHWANDPVGQLIQCCRALRPDGLLLAICLGGQTLTELRQALSQAEIAETGGLSPRIAPMGEIRDLGGLLQRAGLALPVADSVVITAEYHDLLHLMRDLRAMGETNALSERLRRPTRRAVIARAAALYDAGFRTPRGTLPASFEIVTLTGWAPADSQPRPLRPGSAQQRLADALATQESRLQD